MRTICEQCQVTKHRDKGSAPRRDTMINMGLTHEYKAELQRRADDAGMCLTHYMLWAIEEAHRGGADAVPLTNDPRDATYGPEPESIDAPEFVIDKEGQYTNLLVPGPGNGLVDIQRRQAAEQGRRAWNAVQKRNGRRAA
jgi:hypothetical protein